MEDVARHRVERPERLVHQQHVGFLREGARERDALTHAARQLVRTPVAEVIEVHQMEQLGDLLGPVTFGDPAEALRHLDVALDGEPREQRGLLEHQRHAAAADVDRSGLQVVQADDQVEQRRLSAP